MQEIKYRGKVDGVWWYVSPDHVLSLFQSFWNLADRETIGQYTGLKDKSGNEIYQGDVLRRQDTRTSLLLSISVDHGDICGEIVWKEGHGWLFAPIREGQSLQNGTYLMEILFQSSKDFETLQLSQAEVIGNIYEHPELLK